MVVSRKLSSALAASGLSSALARCPNCLTPPCFSDNIKGHLKKQQSIQTKEGFERSGESPSEGHNSPRCSLRKLEGFLEVVTLNRCWKKGRTSKGLFSRIKSWAALNGTDLSDGPQSAATSITCNFV